MATLMVAMGVMAILGAILFPVYACACGRSITAMCLSNQKQEVMAMLMYSGDYDDKLPNRDAWMDVTQPYLKIRTIFRDPLVKSPYQFGYSFNADLSNLSQTSIAEPSKMPTVYDSVNFGRNASDRVTSLPSPGRHEGRNGMALVDGHVKALARGQTRP